MDNIFFSNKNILITGGAGFIGSNLAKRLVDLGAQVTIIDSLIPDYGGNLFNLHGYEDKIQLNIADIRDPYSMNYLVQDRDYIFSLAGQVSHTDSMKNPFTDLEINTKAQLTLLEACRHNNPNTHIVYTSTRQIYGVPKYLPVDENHPLEPVDVNGINKLAAEQYYKIYHKTYNIPVTILRLTNVFGPGMRIKDARQTFIGWWIRQIIEDNPITIFGDGLQIRDINFVEDVVNAILLASNTKLTNGKLYNLGGEKINLLDLAILFVKVFQNGRYELIDFPEQRKKIDIGSIFGNYQKIFTDLGWEPKISIEEGLKVTLPYYKEYFEKYL